MADSFENSSHWCQVQLTRLPGFDTLRRPVLMSTLGCALMSVLLKRLHHCSNFIPQET